MPVELHLPDLPEVPIGLRLPAAPPRNGRPRLAWHLRLRDAFSAYLPLLLMVLLALATWWLVRNTPGAAVGVDELPPRTEPDYVMTRFKIERFDAAGRLKVRFEGDRLRHFPATDRIEAEGVRIRAIAPDGRVTLASANKAISNGDGSEVQLVGGARVTSDDGSGLPLDMSGEFFHAFLVAERVRTHLPVVVARGGSRVQAGGLEYDHGTRRLELAGPIRAVYPPRGGRAR
jgi:lipopolysaccharide export system protein LptC